MKIAVIPARGGSKRIARKNIRDFAGQPMLAHAIGAARASGLFDRIVVSTEDEEIAAVAAQYGAETPFRRAATLADDHTGITAVIADAIRALAAEQAEAVCCIYATAPFVRSEELRQGWELLAAGAWQYVFSATNYAYPVFRSFRQNPDGGLQMLFPEHFTTRSQDLPEALHDAGQFCWGRPRAWLEELRVFGRNSTVVPIPRWRVQDIDTAEDWEHAEIIWQLLQRE